MKGLGHTIFIQLSPQVALSCIPIQAGLVPQEGLQYCLEGIRYPVGVDVLFQEINGANADNKAPSKPERDHWAIFLMKVHQELVQTSASNDIRQIAVLLVSRS